MKRAFSVVMLVLACCLAGCAQTASHFAKLSWSNNDSSTNSYNIYRGDGTCAASPTMAKIANTGANTISVMTYTDSTVIAGNTYCYAVTAVNSAGESPMSALAQAIIPVLLAPTINPLPQVR